LSRGGQTEPLRKVGDAWRYPWIHKVKILKRQKIEAA
jgi:hypothetical protein